MSGFTMNYLNSLTAHACIHSPWLLWLLCAISLYFLNVPHAYMSILKTECGEICKWHAVIFAFILLMQLLVCHHCY